MTDLPNGFYETGRSETFARALRRLLGGLRGKLRVERPPTLSARARNAPRQDGDESFSPLEEFH